TCTLIVREDNRKLINLDEVKALTRKHLRCELFTLSLSQPFAEVRNLVQRSAYLIGVHGAELAMAMFLPSGGAVLELFPYAIPSVNYPPYKTLCHFLGLGYVAWENGLKEKSLGYPD